MRHEPNLRAEQYRTRHTRIGSSEPGANWGYFVVGPLRIISSGTPDGRAEAAGWEHVSVSCIDRTPTWEEMHSVKEMFWTTEETVVQFHPRATAYINVMPYCLHLWRQAGTEPALPPKELIA